MRKLHCLLVGFLLLIGDGLLAQTTEVSGKITDLTGAPIPNASIRIKNSKGAAGTSADAQGAFTIKVKPNSDLIISAIGFETKEIQATGSTLTVVLNTDSKSLSEVVVTGVGVATSKKKLGIAVESVTSDKLPPAPTASIDQALVGKIPGAQISSTSGNPGDPVNIMLRGINTLQNGTKPLIMVDGVQVSATDINSLDLSNVERVEVVQGAASASLYGAQGANGVIQIFTRKGKRGTLAINVSSSFSSNSYINSGHVKKATLHPWLTDANNNIVNTAGTPLTYDKYGDIVGISYTYGGPTRYAILNTQNVDNKPYNANLKYYDHFKEVFQTGSTYNNVINISSATDKSDFSLSAANNHTITPVMKAGYLDRSNLTANLGVELFKGFRLRSITQLIYSRNTITPGLGSPGGYGYGRGNQNGYNGVIYNFLNTSPFFDLKYQLADGTHPSYQVADFVSINAFNPFYQQEYASGLDNKIDVIQNFNANYKVNRFVELDAKYGINYRTENARWTFLNQLNNLNFQKHGSSARYYGPSGVGEIDNFQYSTTFQNFIGSMFIRTDFQNDFKLNLPITTSTQVAFDYRKNVYNEYDTYGEGLSVAPPLNIASTQSQAIVGDFKEPFITYGYLVNQTIDVGNWGGIAGGFRSDYSSAFGEGSKAFTFPHINGYLLPSSFSFWNNSKLSNILSLFKLRAAYGEAGIQPNYSDRYPTLAQNNLGPQLVYSITSTKRNPNLQVEVSKEVEAGTDISIPTNRGGSWFSAINASFTYWHKKSQNVIYTINEPLSTGGTGFLDNAFDLHSNGYQFQVNLPVVNTRTFSWNFTTNWGHQYSIIDKVEGNQPIPVGPVDGNSLYVYLAPGYRIGQLYGYKAIHSFNQTYQDGKTPYFPGGNSGKYQMVEGYVVDTASKAIQFTAEKYALGNTDPKFNASFINEFTYKDFLVFSFQFDWIYGAHMYDETKEWMYRDGIDQDFTKKVTINGQTGAFTAYRASAYYALWGSLHGAGNEAPKDYFLYSASFLRLRNVSAGLDFARLYRIKYVKKLQLVFSGRNIWTKTKYPGMDPEVSSLTPNSAYKRGVDNSSIPNLKSYQVGVNIGF
ncbi:SusC/RagA family TonB-linked outer membrane protein [Puia dinghuensis]|uniref:SusC/RagA family TonB-linked outer membrane protein n=1 Tax=Puia dinghuensis TaxID=1792502 RepID=A0A8J2UGB5_9BACT|nr:SusC/RagA family TonB-linked outer membrane protein [Puia dinghuensis]GGB13340.1 SusC/RagA family TonB-linked outer membrane protein [Puia dinghuensis]